MIAFIPSALAIGPSFSFSLLVSRVFNLDLALSLSMSFLLLKLQIMWIARMSAMNAVR